MGAVAPPTDPDPPPLRQGTWILVPPHQGPGSLVPPVRGPGSSPSPPCRNIGVVAVQLQQKR